MSLYLRPLRPAIINTTRCLRCNGTKFNINRVEINKSWVCRYSVATNESPVSEQPEIYDVVIIGGGVTGLTLAAALKSSRVTKGLRIALVEGQKTKNWKGQDGIFSNRVSSLTPNTVRFLQTIGAWDFLDHSRIQTFEDMQVWDGVSDTRIHFAWDKLSGSASVPVTGPTIGTMCENVNLTQALLTKLSQYSEDEFTAFDGTRVQKIEYGQETDDLDLTSWPVVTIENGKTLAARLLVGADGGNSPVRRFAEIESRGWEYGRHGFVASLQIEEPDEPRTAYQRFLPTGPVALLPLPGRYATLVWSTTPAHAAQLRSLSEEDFVAMVNAAFRLSHVDLEYLSTLQTGIKDEVDWRLQITKHPAPPVVPTLITKVQENTRMGFPLRMSHADTYIKERAVLVGDAAHTVHPLAGQGLNSGQGDAESLVKTLEFAVLHGQDIGSLLSLEPYLSDRYVKNNALLGVVDKLHKIYGTKNSAIVGLRGLGQRIVNQDWLGVKGFFMKQAAGS